MRDNQRQKVYDSEHAIDHGASFTTVAECQAYVDRVLARKRLQRKYPRLPKKIVVRPGFGRIIACAETLDGQRVIKLPLWSRTELTILHEISHHVAESSDGIRWAHNWKFAAIHLSLVREMMGVDAERALRDQYRARRVRYTEPRAKRPLTEEQRSAAADRLAAAREARLGERGRWALRTDGGAWVKRVVWKFGRCELTFTAGTAEGAMVWTTLPAVERWVERCVTTGWTVEVVDLSDCSAPVH
jgi:putative metallohydrolase (TIGR04338 family)